MALYTYIHHHFLNVIYCILIFGVVSNSIQAQDLKIQILDSIQIKSDQIYLDQLNQMYVVQSSEHQILKYDDQLNIKKEISSSFYAEPIFMSVVDPMKLILFIPSYSNVQILNTDLTLLSDEYYQDFNSESSITYYSSQTLCYFSNGKITLKHLADKRIIESENIYYHRTKELRPTEIKSNGRDIFLLIPGVGVWYFNEFLKLEKFIDDVDVEHIDLFENKLFMSKHNQLEIFNLNMKSMIQSIPFHFPIQSFAVNKNYIILANSSGIIRYKIL